MNLQEKKEKLKAKIRNNKKKQEEIKNLDGFKCNDCGEFNEYCTCNQDEDLSDNGAFE